jgi:hypothetical protein
MRPRFEVWTLMDGTYPMFVVVERDPHTPKTAHLRHWFTEEEDADAWVAEREALRGDVVL